jgi:hypothetical protein
MPGEGKGGLPAGVDNAQIPALAWIGQNQGETAVGV